MRLCFIFFTCVFFLGACTFYTLMPSRKENSQIVVRAEFKDPERKVEKYLSKKNKKNYISDLNIKGDSNSSVYSFVLKARSPIRLNEILFYQKKAIIDFPFDTSSITLLRMKSDQSADTLLIKKNHTIVIDKSKEYDRLMYRHVYFYLRK